MGLFSGISAWNANRIEKHRSKMEEKGLCPECYGRGYTSFVPTEYHFLISTIVQAAMVVVPILIGRH